MEPSIETPATVRSFSRGPTSNSKLLAIHATHPDQSWLLTWQFAIWNTGPGGYALFHTCCIIRIFDTEKPSVWGKHERLQDYPKDNTIYQSISRTAELFSNHYPTVYFNLSLFQLASSWFTGSSTPESIYESWRVVKTCLQHCVHEDVTSDVLPLILSRTFFSPPSSSSHNLFSILIFV